MGLVYSSKDLVVVANQVLATSISLSEKVVKVLLGEVLAFKFCDLFFKFVVLFLHLCDFVRPHAFGFCGKLSMEIQVFRDCWLRIDINLDLVDGLLVGNLFFLEVDFLSGDDTYLAELEEDFEIWEEVGVVRCVFAWREECLNVAYIAVSILVNSVGNRLDAFFIKFFGLAFSDMWAKYGTVFEKFLFDFCLFIDSICITRKELCERIKEVQLLFFKTTRNQLFLDGFKVLCVALLHFLALHFVHFLNKVVGISNLGFQSIVAGFDSIYSSLKCFNLCLSGSLFFCSLSNNETLDQKRKAYTTYRFSSCV